MMSLSTRRILVVALVVSTVLVFLSFPANDAVASSRPAGLPGIDGDELPAGSWHAVDTCTTISRPGTYVLVRSLEGTTESCIRITASGVLLDGNGHSIRGQVSQGTAAVEVGPADDGWGPIRNVAVRNLSLQYWVFGVVYDDVVDGRIDDVSTFRTVDGITVRDATNVRLTNVRVTDGFVGISVIRSTDVDVVDTTARWLTTIGVSVIDSRSVTISNVAVAHTEIGVDLLGASDVTIVDLSVTDAATTAVREAETVQFE